MLIKNAYRLLLAAFVMAGIVPHVVAQNNQGIFVGGGADGFAEDIVFVAGSNAIFSGSTGDGFDENILQQASSSAIFAGGVGDGFDESQYLTTSSNAIFAGGSDDGFDENYFASVSSNAIFSGGPGDGFDEFTAHASASNPIFAGGAGDGFDELIFMDQASNPIFAGGQGDGFDETQFNIECDVITWTGQQDSSWDNPLNWTPERVPYPCDLVIIPPAPNDAIISGGSLGIDFLNGLTSRGAKKLIIEQGGKLLLKEDAVVEIQNELRVAGTLMSQDNAAAIILQTHPGGEITLKSTGVINLSQ